MSLLSSNEYHRQHVFQPSRSSWLSKISASVTTKLQALMHHATIPLAWSGTQDSHSLNHFLGTPPSCPNAQISCRNTTAVLDTCCFNAPGGQLLQTQFWDYDPATGPSDSWTIHGLWPDHCDGTFDANCDPTRAYTNISDIIAASGATDLLNDMQVYWKDYQGHDETFWEHEWSKHGTCISTLDPKCYQTNSDGGLGLKTNEDDGSGYIPQQEVVDFFQRTVDLFKNLPSYDWLATAGIVPSLTRTYSFNQIMEALRVPRGVDVAIQCKRNRALDEIWYFFDVRGSVQTGTFIPSEPDGAKSSCPRTGIRYLPKNGGSSPRPAPFPPSPAPSPSGPFEGRGQLHVLVDGHSQGCIISRGSWYTSGTCAKFRAMPATIDAKQDKPSYEGKKTFTLSNWRGKCYIRENGEFKCGSTGTEATIFTASGKLLSHDINNNSVADTTWYASQQPKREEQIHITTENAPVRLEIMWQPTT